MRGQNQEQARCRDGVDGRVHELLDGEAGLPQEPSDGIHQSLAWSINCYEFNSCLCSLHRGYRLISCVSRQWRRLANPVGAGHASPQKIFTHLSLLGWFAKFDSSTKTLAANCIGHQPCTGAGASQTSIHKTAHKLCWRPILMHQIRLKSMQLGHKKLSIR